MDKASGCLVFDGGLNENTNSLIRSISPKGSSFEEITDEQVETVIHRLNHCPSYETPHTVFFEQFERKAKAA